MTADLPRPLALWTAAALLGAITMALAIEGAPPPSGAPAFTGEVYRDLLSALPDGQNGLCLQGGVAATSMTDPALPGTGWFYLITSRNSLGEEGTKGFAGNGTERANPGPCP